MRTSVSRLLPLLLAFVACRAEPSQDGAEPQVTGVVDSVVPIPEALDRFRADVEKPAGLHGPASLDTLLREMIAALRQSDTLAFERLAVNRAEWAWLYYPTTAISKPPYELPPALAWFQLREANRKGVFRALREFGGRTLQFEGYACPAEATTEGENRIWSGCTVTLGRDGEAPVTLRLFSAILERDGHFAFLSYANDF